MTVIYHDDEKGKTRIPGWAGSFHKIEQICNQKSELIFQLNLVSTIPPTNH